MWLAGVNEIRLSSRIVGCGKTQAAVYICPAVQRNTGKDGGRGTEKTEERERNSTAGIDLRLITFAGYLNVASCEMYAQVGVSRRIMRGSD